MATVDQILTVAQMRDTEAALIAAGSSIEALMDVAGRGAADYVWRIAGHRPVTVLCGPGNNGGDGYVIAETIRQRGGKVRVIAATEPRTPAAINARSLYKGELGGSGGEVLVDACSAAGWCGPSPPSTWRCSPDSPQHIRSASPSTCRAG